MKTVLRASTLGLCLLSFGCPQLLDDGFSSFGTDGGAPSNGGGGGAPASAGSAGAGGASGSHAAAAGAGPSGGAGQANGASGGGSGSAGSAGSSGSAGGSGAGGAAGAAACNFGDFSAPELLSTLGRADALYGPALSGNGLVLAFSESLESAPEDIFLSQRAARDSAFGAALPALGVNTVDAEGTAFLTGDARVLYFFSDRSGGPGDRDIYRATRGDGSAEFTDVRLVEGINGNTDDHTPWLSPDERTLYFASNRAADSDGNNLWFAQRSSPLDGFEPPREVPGMNSDERDISPSLSADQRTLVFCSDRDGGAGSDDIWMATRDDAASDFGTPAPVPVVNGTASELNVALSDDGRELIFSSSRSGDRRLYRSVRACL